MDLKAIEETARILIEKKNCVVVSGAGISVPSGIPDFRSKGGLWDRFEPSVYATAEAWEDRPEMVWEMFREVGKMLMEARPNRAHYVIGSLEQRGIVAGVITQNIDGLHQLGGSKNVVEFHGNGRIIYCTRCGRKVDERREVEIMEGSGLPFCEECGGVVRPDVVLFGEPIPMDAIRRSSELISACRILMVVGTSGIVMPAAGLIYQAKQIGAFIVEINLSTTPISSISDISLRGSADKVLEEVEKWVKVCKV